MIWHLITFCRSKCWLAFALNILSLLNYLSHFPLSLVLLLSAQKSIAVVENLEHRNTVLIQEANTSSYLHSNRIEGWITVVLLEQHNDCMCISSHSSLSALCSTYWSLYREFTRKLYKKLLKREINKSTTRAPWTERSEPFITGSKYDDYDP